MTAVNDLTVAAAAARALGAAIAGPLDAQPRGTFGVHDVVSLDTFAFGLIRTARDGRILAANGEADRLLRERDGLQRTGANYLAAARDSETRRLAHLIAAACAGARGAVSVSRAAGRRPFSLVLLPATAAPLPAALIFIGDLDHRVDALTDRLRVLFGLTAAEARIAVALGHGQELADIRARRGVKMSTLREQVSSILAKTDTRRQAQLVALVSRLATLG